MFEIELFICIKMDLGLNNQERLICHKNPTNQPAKTYLQQLCMYTGCSLEDLPEAMDDGDGERERELGKSVRARRHDDDDDDDNIYIYIYI